MQLSHFNHIVRQVLILPVLALLITAAALAWQIHTGNVLVDRIQISDAAITQANLVGQLIVDQETGLRGYQVTGDPRFLEPLRGADRQLPAAFDRLASLTDATPTNAVLINRLQLDKQQVQAFRSDYLAWRQAFAAPIIAASGRNTSAVDLNLRGKVLMDKVRFDLTNVITSAEDRRQRRAARWHAQVRFLGEVLLVSALLAGLLIGLFTLNRLHLVSRAYQAQVNSVQQQADELFLSEQQLRTTLASIGDGVITCDPGGRVTMLNQVAAELTGWLPGDALGQPLETVFNIINETTRAVVENPAAKVKRLNRVVGLANHTILIRKDGVELNIDDSGAPIRNPAGDLTGIIMVFRDITLEKRTRDALIANEKLAVAGRLAATIAHEIHNPLDSVSNLLYLMGPTTSPEEAAHFLELARQELDRVTQISRSMLSLYRESKAPVTIDVKDMLEGTLLLLERRIQDLGVTIQAELPANLRIDGFPGELRQVFTNLITNAAEAAGPGGHVCVRSRPRDLGPTFSPGFGLSAEERPLPGVVIEIEDSGPGIPAEFHDKLFQPFFSTKGEQGTGLGLWVSRGIIRKHGGDISLHSLPTGRGTLATVSLATEPVIVPGGD